MRLQCFNYFILLPLLLTGFFPVHAETEAKYQSNELQVNIKSRTPQQMAAFYGARGFDKTMIEELTNVCFVTVFIKNKSQDIIWLDLNQWQFSNINGPLERLDRIYWSSKWKQMNAPLAHQSTFRWTLLPETLDFYPDEREGGNIILPRTNLPFTIKANFPTQADRSGSAHTVVFNNLTCAEDP